MVFFLEREIKNQIENKNKTNGQVMMSWKIKLNETKKNYGIFFVSPEQNDD